MRWIFLPGPISHGLTKHLFIKFSCCIKYLIILGLLVLVFVLYDEKEIHFLRTEGDKKT